MLSSLALILCLIYIFYFFHIDKNISDGVSKAILIPFTWICFGGSRYLSYWLNLSTPSVTLDVYAEGSPVDRAIFLLLIIAGIIVLYKRNLPWKEVFSSNIWVFLYFLFGLISIAWSDFPYVALKRWVKGLGNVIMALIILTETKPYKALEHTLRKMAFILLPLSVLFINYYPHIGRAYHMGRPVYVGVAGHKNGLGVLCLVSGIYFCWMFFFRTEWRAALKKKARIAIYSVMVIMIVWLFLKADSATSLFCMFVAIFVLILSRMPSFRQNPQSFLYFFILLFFMAISLESLLGVKDKIITLLGREPSLTSRVPMWKDLILMVRNPILGFGFDSFWLGERQLYIYETWGIAHNAHNGYLEMYLNLGLIGVSFIFAWILSGLHKIRRYVNVDYSVGMLRFTIVLIVAIFNYTEAVFYGVSLWWVLFFFAIMDPPNNKIPFSTGNLRDSGAMVDK